MKKRKLPRRGKLGRFVSSKKPSKRTLPQRKPTRKSTKKFVKIKSKLKHSHPARKRKIQYDDGSGAVADSPAIRESYDRSDSESTFEDFLDDLEDLDDSEFDEEDEYEGTA